VRLNKIILLVKTNEIYFLFLRQFEDAFENIGSLFKIKALKMVCYICNYILIFRFCKYTNDYILFKKEEPTLFKDDQSAIKRNLINIDRKLSQLSGALLDELRIEINKININDLT